MGWKVQSLNVRDVSVQPSDQRNISQWEQGVRICPSQGFQHCHTTLLAAVARLTSILPQLGLGLGY